MSFANDGYLGLSIDGTSPSVAIPVISLTSICLICQMGIGFITGRQMASHKNIRTQFKVTFGACLVFAIAGTIMEILWSPIFWDSWNITTIVILICFNVLCGFSLFTCSLLILVLRLRLVFSEFMQMSNRIYIGFKCILTVLYLIILFLCIVVVMAADYSTDTFTDDTYSHEVFIVIYVLGFSFFVLYSIGTVCATLFFLNNLRNVALSQVSSPCNLEEDIPLNKQQQRIINLASRYALLFLIAVSSDIVIIVLLNSTVNIESGIRYVLFAMDFTINLICVYLQFAFSGEHYRRCCGCIHMIWKKRVGNIVRRAIRKHRIEQSASNSFSSATTSPNPTMYVSFSETFFESTIDFSTSTQVKSEKINIPIPLRNSLVHLDLLGNESCRLADMNDIGTRMNV